MQAAVLCCWSDTVHRQSRNVQTPFQALQKQIVTVLTQVHGRDMQWCCLFSGDKTVPSQPHHFRACLFSPPCNLGAALLSSAANLYFASPGLTIRLFWAELF